jgi:hypothetical protein
VGRYVAIGFAMKRVLLAGAVQDDPEPAAFEKVRPQPHVDMGTSTFDRCKEVEI